MRTARHATQSRQTLALSARNIGQPKKEMYRPSANVGTGGKGSIGFKTACNNQQPHFCTTAPRNGCQRPQGLPGSLGLLLFRDCADLEMRVVIFPFGCDGQLLGFALAALFASVKPFWPAPILLVSPPRILFDLTPLSRTNYSHAHMQEPAAIYTMSHSLLREYSSFDPPSLTGTDKRVPQVSIV
jgi:hypothetical protein